MKLHFLEEVFLNRFEQLLVAPLIVAYWQEKTLLEKMKYFKTSLNDIVLKFTENECVMIFHSLTRR